MSWSHGFAMLCKKHNINRRVKTEIKSLLNCTVINEIAMIEYERNQASSKIDKIKTELIEMCDDSQTNKVSESIERCINIIEGGNGYVGFN
jgi:hypothetical protein